MDGLQAALVSRGWRMWVAAAIVGAVVFHMLHIGTAAWTWYQSLGSNLQSSLPVNLGTPTLDEDASLWSLAWGALSGAFSFLFAAQGSAHRPTYAMRALQWNLLKLEPGTFLYEMYWLVVPAAIVGGIGLISTLLNSPIAQPALGWIRAHKKATGAIVFQGIASVLLIDGIADMLASPETSPSPFRGIALFSTGIICVSAALSLLSEKFMYLAFPTTSLILIKAWGTFIAYCSFTLSHKRGEFGAGMLYRLAGVGTAVLTVAVTAAARYWWTHDWQKRFENILFRAIGITHIIGTAIAALALGAWPFTWHVLPVLLISVAEVTGVLRNGAVVNFFRATMAMLYMVTINTALLFASRACVGWAFTFLDVPLLSFRFWLVNLWIFIFLMILSVLAVVAAWFVVSATYRYAPRAYKALWLMFDLTKRSFFPLLKMGVRLGGLALLEAAGTCLLESLLLGTDPSQHTFTAWATGLAVVIGLCMAISSFVLRTMSVFRDLKCAELPLGIGAGVVHAATRILLADASPPTIALCTPLLATVAIVYDASFGWPTATVVYNHLRGPMLAAKRAAIAVATCIDHAIRTVLRHLVIAARFAAHTVMKALVWTAMRLRSVVRGATPLLQPSASAAVTALFLRPLLTKPSLTLSDLGFLLSAWAGLCSTVILTGAAFRSRRIHELGLRMFDKVDFGLALLAFHVLTASSVQLARLLRVLSGAVQTVLHLLSNMVYNLWGVIARGIRTVTRAGLAQFSLIWRNPLVAMASAAVVIAIAYQVHTLGLRPQGAIDVVWDLALVLWEALCYAAACATSLHEMARPFMARAAQELAVWRQTMVGSASSADLFRMVSFAWVFYLSCVIVSVTKVHRRMRSKTIAVPIMVLYVTAYLAPSMFNIAALLLLLWILGSIVVWEQDIAQRRQAEAQWAQMHARRRQQRGTVGPRFVVPETDASKFTEQVYEADECVICQEAFEGDTHGYTLPCGHRAFHRECLNDWFSACTNARCPICRAPADQRTQWLQTVF